jgi:hypothetical protein
MATYLNLVNSVLRKLREDEVTSVSDTDYSTLVGDFVNLVKEEMEVAHKWNVLRDTIQVTTSSGTWQYALTGSGAFARIVNVWNDTEDCWLKYIPGPRMTELLNTAPTTNDSPIWYNINGLDSSGDLVVDLYPVPNATETINFNIVQPEAELSSDSDSTELPTRAIVFGAWAMAVSERGEDGGLSYDELQQRYMNALADAIAIDAGHQEDEYDMKVT